MCLCSPSKSNQDAMIRCSHCEEEFHLKCEQISNREEVLKFFCTSCETNHGLSTEYISAESSEGLCFGEHYEVEKIMNHRRDNYGYEYHIQWKDYSMSDATWEPERNLLGCPITLRQYKLANHLSDDELPQCFDQTNERALRRRCYSSIHLDLSGAPADVIVNYHNSVQICNEVINTLSAFAQRYSKRDKNQQLAVGCLNPKSFRNDGITLIPFKDEVFIILYLKRHDIGFITDINNSSVVVDQHEK